MARAAWIPMVLAAFAACSGPGGGSGDAADGEPGDGGTDGALDGPSAEDADPGDDADRGAGDVPAEADGDDVSACGPDADPLALWRERSELDLTAAGSTTRLGEIDGSCAVDGYRVLAARGMRLRFEAATAASSRVTVRLALFGAGALAGPPATPRAETFAAPGLTAGLEVSIAASGEHLLLVHDLDLRDAAPYALSVRCLEGCGLRATRFPIVLLHGFGGWDTILGGLEYFYDVEDDLEARGYDVHCPTADAANDTPTRARQFEAQIDDILAAGGARKVSFVAHSQGGLDARHLISTLGWGDRVGALVTISTPHRGTIVADALAGDLPVSAAVLAALLDAWGRILGSDAADTRAAFAQMTTARVVGEFEPAHPDDPRVQYWSYAGRSCAVLDFGCRAGNSDETVDPLLRVSFEILSGDGPGQGPNDGLVTVESATRGLFLGAIPADHWDEIGQLADAGPGGPLDHLAFYASIAARLHDAGL